MREVLEEAYNRIWWRFSCLIHVVRMRFDWWPEEEDI